MTGIALELPQDVVATRDGVLRFVESEVAPRIARNHALLEDQRQLFEDSGRYSARVRDLIRDVRMLSARAGFYGMCAPEVLWGRGSIHLAYYSAFGATNRRLRGLSAASTSGILSRSVSP